MIVMRMFVISDNSDTYTGMKLSGVNGVIVKSKPELIEQLDIVLADKTIGIVLITEKLCNEARETINNVKLNKKIPLIVEIPDRHGTGRKPNFITAYVNEAIGLKL